MPLARDLKRESIPLNAPAKEISMLHSSRKVDSEKLVGETMGTSEGMGTEEITRY